MTTRSDNLELRVTANDQASAVVDRLADKVDGLESRPHDAELTATDRASGDVQTLRSRLSALTDAEFRAVLQVQATQAQRELDQINRKLAQAERYDQTEVDLFIEARDQASRKLAAVKQEAEELDRMSPDVEVGADTSQFSTSLDGIQSALEGLNVPASGLVSKLGPGGGVAAGAAAIGVGMFAAANHAADAALEVETLAGLTGDTNEEMSALLGTWQQTGAEGNDLADILLNINSVLADSPELASQLGIELNDGRSMGQRFVQLVDALNNKITDTGERGVLASRLFGEEGVRQVGALTALIGGDLADAVENYGGPIFDEEDAESAREYKRQLQELKTEFNQLSATVGGPLVTAFADALGAANSYFDAVGNAGDRVGDFLFGESDAEQAVEAFESSEAAARDFDRTLLDGLETYGAVHDAVMQHTGDLHTANVVANEWADTNEWVAEVVEETKEATTDYGRSLDDAQRQLNQTRLAQQRANDETERARQEARSAASAVYELHNAELGLENAVSQANDALADGTQSAMQVRSQLEQVAIAADRVAQEQVAMKGLTLESAAGQHEWAASMLNSAQTMSGPLRTEVANYVSQVTGIPRSIVSTIGVNVDAAALAAIEADLNWTARERFVRINPQGGGQNRYATGTTGAQPGAALVGENGPELVVMRGGERVYNAHDTARMMSGGGNTTVQINVPHGYRPEDILRLQRLYERRNGVAQ